MIGADNQVALLTTGNTRRASGRHLVDMFHEQMATMHHRHPGIKVELRWMPGHEGIPGNEHADTEAKMVEWGKSSPCHQLPVACKGTILVSRSAAQQYHSKMVKEMA